MPQSFTCLHYHLIFSTKSRLPTITADLQTRLYDYLGGILRSEKSILLAAGGMPDHVHLLCSLSKELAVAEALRTIKAILPNGFMRRSRNTVRSPGRPVMGPSRSVIPTSPMSNGISRA